MPETALVVADDRRDRPEVVEEVAPDRALPVVLEVAEPARGDDERRAGSVDRVREPCAVGRAAEANLLVAAGGRVDLAATVIVATMVRRAVRRPC